ncbi:MAG: hypothetical protein JRM80_10780 [Nitrososphaerota archaeon]|nr:hypothetical protein [Nitrososphaerota archaeon]
MKAQALQWLLEPSNPAVRYLTLTDIMRKSPGAREAKAARKDVMSYPPVADLKSSQGKRGYWLPEDESYNPKFTATIWQLMLLGEMGVPPLPWIDSATKRLTTQHWVDSGAWTCSPVGEKVEEEPCISGNMLRTMTAFGYDDPRIQKGLDWLPEIQLEDGGWNCDTTPGATHSSFMSTIEPLWAFSEYPRQKWTRKMKASAERGAEFLLAHRVYKSHRDWRPVELKGLEDVFSADMLTKFHFPMYYYYDALHGLRVLTKLGYQDDERIGDAVHLLLSKMTPEGKWLLEGDWVRERRAHRRKTLVTVEELGRPSKWITLNCYRVLAQTGDLDLPN